MILRMCNDLLKRLSRTIDTSFCGRILVLLARALPLCEKSGLNLVSHFNSDNITKYDSVSLSFLFFLMTFSFFSQFQSKFIYYKLFI